MDLWLFGNRRQHCQTQTCLPLKTHLRVSFIVPFNQHSQQQICTVCKVLPKCDGPAGIPGTRIKSLLFGEWKYMPLVPMIANPHHTGWINACECRMGKGYDQQQGLQGVIYTKYAKAARRTTARYAANKHRALSSGPSKGDSSDI